MPSVNLTIESNLGPVVNTFKQAGELIEQTEDSIQSLTKTTQNSFKTSATEVNKFNTEVKKGTKEISNLDGSTKAIPKSVNRLKELKQEIKALTSEAINLKLQGDIIGSDLAIKNAGKLKDELKDVQDAISSVSGNAKENLGKALVSATQIGVQGFEAVTAASSLFGEKNEEVEKQLVKLQAIQSLSRIASEFGDVRDKIDNIKRGLEPLGKNLKVLYTAGNEGLKNLAKNGIGSFSGLLQGAKGFFSNFGSGLKNLVTSGIQGVKALGAAAAANPFGLILIAIVAVIGVMVALRDKVKPIADLFSFLGKIIDNIGDSLQKLGEALNIVADAQERQRDAIIKGNEEAVKAIERRYAREIKLASSAGQDTKSIEGQKLKEVYNTNQKTIEALIQKKDAAGELNKEELAQFKELIEKQKDIVTDVQALANEKRKEEADKEKEKNKKILEDNKAAAEKLKQLRKELADFLLELQKKSNAAEIELLTGEEKINAQRAAAQAEIDLLKETLIKKKVAARQGNTINEVEAKEFRNLELLANQTQAEALLKLEVEKSNKLAEEKRKQIDNEIKFLETKNKLAIAQIQGTKNTTGLSEVEFEEIKQKAILIAQKNGAQEILTAKLDALNNQKDLTKEQYDLETELIIKETQNQVDEVDKKIAELEKKLPKKKLIDWATLLGVNEEDLPKLASGFQNLQNELANVASAILSSQNALLDAEEKANDERKALADQRVLDRESELKSLEDSLAKEQGLRAEGLANNVSLIEAQIQAKQDQIAEEKLQQDAALAEEARIKAERQKLARQQAIVDTITQGSNLLTSASNIYASLSPLGPIGVTTAIATIAAMLSAFAIAKAQIFNSLKNAEFKEGGYTGGTSASEERGTVHGLEFVHTADKTKKYRNLFEGIHNDNDFLIQKGIEELIAGKGIGLERDLPITLSQKKDNIRISTLNNSNANKGMERQIELLHSEVKNLNKKLDNKTTVLSNGTIIEKKGLITRTTKAKNE